MLEEMEKPRTPRSNFREFECGERGVRKLVDSITD
jgi:hypothetical protein